MGNRASLNGLVLELRRREKILLDIAETIVADFAQDGERDMEKIIETAVTRTGQARADGTTHKRTDSTSPGRVDTGLMINSVSSEYDRKGTTFTGTFGWTKETMDYFLYQENGTEAIGAMNALHGSFIKNRELAVRKINDAVKGN